MGFDVFKQYATNEKVEVEGAWVDIGDAKLLIARLGNKNYVKKIAKAYERNRKLLDRKDQAADDLSDRIMIEVLADTILLGWENLEFDGKTLPYSKDNAAKVLAVKDFRTFVMELAGDDAEYRLHKDVESGND